MHSGPAAQGWFGERLVLGLGLACGLALVLAFGGGGASASVAQRSGRATGLTAAVAHSADQTTLYVNGATGNDDGGDNSCQIAAQPCKTIGQAVSVAANGDTIQIAAGTYDEGIQTGLNLTFIGAGASGANATVVDSQGNPYGAFSLSGTSTVEDLTAEDFDSGIGGAVSVFGSGAVTLDGLDINTDGQTAGTDGIGAGGASLTVNDCTINVINNDADVANGETSTHRVVFDGSGIEATAGTVSVSDSLITTTDGIALRLHGSASSNGPTSTTVTDSVLEVNGVEDIQSGQPGYIVDQWQAIEAAGGTLSLIGDTVYNATVGRSTSSPQGPTDALYIPDQATGVTVSIDDSILRAQPDGNRASTQGADIDAAQSGVTTQDVTAQYSSFSSVSENNGANVTANDVDGNILGDPGFSNPPVNTDVLATDGLALAPGSALIGAGDPSAPQPGELDVDGNARALSCMSGATATNVVNIGAYETAPPSCPAPLSSGDSTGALTQLTGAFNCVTGDTDANTGCATTGVAGMTGGTPSGTQEGQEIDAVESPDGNNVYVASEDMSTDGVDVAEFARDPASGGLAQLALPNNCMSSSPSGTSGCGTANVAELAFVVGTGFSGPVVIRAAPRMAISPDGMNVYVDTGDEIAEFARDPNTGALTPMAAQDCVSDNVSSSPSPCTVSNDESLGPAAGFVVSPDGTSVYLATTDECSFAVSPVAPALRPQAIAADAGVDAGDPENANCNNNPANGFFAQANLDLLSRNPATGVLTPVECYANSATDFGCKGGYYGLYAMTSLAVSPDGTSVYVTGDAGGTASQLSASGGVPFYDPGEITELQRDPSTGELTEGAGFGACITAGVTCTGTELGTVGVPGLVDPQQIVVGPDGDYAYVVSSQYYDVNQSSSVDSGPLVSSDVVTLARDPSSGALSQISDAPCYAGWYEACESEPNTPGVGDPYANTVEVPGLDGGASLAISADGQNLYVASANPGVDSGAVAFSRDTTTGLLTPLSPPATCLANGTPPGAGGIFGCADTSVAGLSSGVSDLPSWLIASPDCQSVYIVSDGVAEFSRGQPASGPGCPGPYAAALSFSASGLTFGSASSPVAIGTTSGPATLTVTNTGNAPLVISADALGLGGSSPFSIDAATDTCSGQVIQPAGTCTVQISFTPTSAGSVSDQLLVSDNAADSPQGLGLSGYGAGGGGAPAVSLTPTSLTFGSSTSPVTIGTTSGPQGVTVTDSGGAPLDISQVALAMGARSPFSIASDGCSGQTLQPMGTCTVKISFTPASAGSVSDQLTVADNASGSPQALSLTGFGAAPSGSAALSFSTTGLNFGTGATPIAVGTASVQQTVTITDSGSGSLSITMVALGLGSSSPFVIGPDTCAGQTLAPQGTCTVAISYDPSAATAQSDTLVVTDSAADSPQSLNLNGVGGEPQASLSATSLSFGISGGEIAVGSTSTAQTITITDTGREPLTFDALSVKAVGAPPGAPPSPFALTADACSGRTLQPSGTCTVSVAMAPTSAGEFAADVLIPDNAPVPGSQQTVALKGDASLPSVSLDATSLAWNGTAYEVKTVTATDSGTALLTFGGSTATTAGGGSVFLVRDSTCDGHTIAPGATCTIDVEFAPTAPGSFTGALQVNDDAAGSPQSVSLSGSAAGGTIAGHITGPGGGPLAHVYTAVCPSGTGVGACTSAVTAADGSYSVNVISGTWRLQVSAPGGYDEASAVDQVEPGQTVTQDFALHAPIPLSGGVTVDAIDTVQSSGVPTVNWQAPFQINQPLTVPMTGTPNTTQLFYDVSGIGDDTGTISGSAFNLAGLMVFGVRYGPDGQAEGVTDPLSGEIDCQPTPGSPSPCAALIPDPSSLPAGTSQARAAARSVAGVGTVASQPAAHAAIDCPARAQVGFSIVPDQTYGGVDFVYTEPDGTQHVFILGQAQIAPLDSTGNPLADAVLNIGRIGLNFAVNFNPYVGAYNAFISALQALTISAHSNNMQLQGLENGRATVGLLVAALNAETHGAAYWVGQIFSGVFSYSANYENGLNVQVTPNCPPMHNDFYIDPSGKVQTTTKVPVAGATVAISRSATATGKLARVPKGSTLLSPGNRRNPDRTSISGAFGWDVAPGYYRISATHAGCRSAVARGGSSAVTPLLAVPPEQTNLTLTLSCPHYRRTASAVTLRVIKGPDGMHVLVARVTAKGRRVSATRLAGTVAFAANGKSLGAVGVDLRSGAAVLDLPSTRITLRTFTAAYAGNGLYAPSRARAKA